MMETPVSTHIKANPGVLHKYNCNEDKVCGSLTGVCNCALGHCANMFANLGVVHKYNCNEDKVCGALTGVCNCALGHCANMFANLGVVHKYNCNEDKVCGALTGVCNCALGHCANMFANLGVVHKYNCNEDKVCGALTGVCNCALGHCANMFANPGVLHKYNCNEDKVCGALTGVFNCSLGHCANMSELFLCHYKADGIIVDSDKDNLKLNGFFECYKSRCTKIKNMRNFYCERYCPRISTTANNIYIQYENNVYTGQCGQVTAHNRAQGNEPGSSVQPTTVWSDKGSGEVFLASCHTVTRHRDNRLSFRTTISLYSVQRPIATNADCEERNKHVSGSAGTNLMRKGS
ncbi:hypothetical protein J6590_000408 [Homalodisca vitripennis]|nr:hypothetical protein J6590_000408 [Homalodisca vitripennis]